eukprot:TRINITY_DN8021_c0_g1_i1.p2 TRINITY_DN8021_c0_g1~~TRINITY_DN8021_c0_g1_i1.p2  ORF type:complete len:328 (+),score=126.92 TRINITY_DN8021_c0_g1_i1:64-1047(+)
MATRTYSAKKEGFFTRMNQYLDEYEKIVVVSCDNVTSRQFNKMRIGMRPTGDLPFVGKILMGKNTMMKKVMKDRLEADPTNAVKEMQYEKFNEILKLNVGLIFTNDDLSHVVKMVDENVVQAQAKVGAVAPCDVHIPAGPTGLEPGQTSFFQALNIHTKITKGSIDILNEVHLIKQNEKVGPSEATLLQKMGLKPFYYGLMLVEIYDKGTFFSPKVLRMTTEEKEAKVKAAIANVTGLSLALGWTTQASFPHVAMNAFKNIFSVSLGTDYDFDAFGAAQLKQDIKEGKVSAAPAAAAAASSDAPKAAAAAAPVEESEDEDMGMDLFD